MNIVEAKNAVAQMSDDEKLLLAQAERGVALAAVDTDALKSLHDKAYVRVAPFSNVHAFTAIEGVVLTDDGIKIMQALKEYKPEELVELESIANEIAVEAIIEQTEALDEPVDFDERKYRSAPKERVAAKVVKP